MMALGLLWAAPALLAASATPDPDCELMPPTPPGPQESWETDEYYRSRVLAWEFQQKYLEDLATARRSGLREGFEMGLWELAPTIVLAEIVAKGETSPGESMFGVMPQVTLRVKTIAKGTARDGDFKFTYSGLTQCGPIGHVSIVDGEVGDHFILFSRDADLSMNSVIVGYSREQVKSQRSKTLFEQHRGE
jgi:hypothetical protein